jgi:hypothetical protein
MNKLLVLCVWALGHTTDNAVRSWHSGVCPRRHSQQQLWCIASHRLHLQEVKWHISRRKHHEALDPEFLVILSLWHRWPTCQCHVVPMIQVANVSVPCCPCDTGDQCVSVTLFLWYRWPMCQCHVVPVIQVANVSVSCWSSDTGG